MPPISLARASEAATSAISLSEIVGEIQDECLVSYVSQEILCTECAAKGGGDGDETKETPEK